MCIYIYIYVHMLHCSIVYKVSAGHAGAAVCPHRNTRVSIIVLQHDTLNSSHGGFYFNTLML